MSKPKTGALVSASDRVSNAYYRERVRDFKREIKADPDDDSAEWDLRQLLLARLIQLDKSRPPLTITYGGKTYREHLQIIFGEDVNDDVFLFQFEPDYDIDDDDYDDDDDGNPFKVLDDLGWANDGIGYYKWGWEAFDALGELAPIDSVFGAWWARFVAENENLTVAELEQKTKRPRRQPSIRANPSHPSEASARVFYDRERQTEERNAEVFKARNAWFSEQLNQESQPDRFLWQGWRNLLLARLMMLDRDRPPFTLEWKGRPLEAELWFHLDGRMGDIANPLVTNDRLLLVFRPYRRTPNENDEVFYPLELRGWTYNSTGAWEHRLDLMVDDAGDPLDMLAELDPVFRAWLASFAQTHLKEPIGVLARSIRLSPRLGG